MSSVHSPLWKYLTQRSAAKLANVELEPEYVGIVKLFTILLAANASIKKKTTMFALQA